MARSKARAEASGRKKMALAVLALVVAAAAAVLYTVYGQGCEVEVESICLTTNYLYINATGGCTLTARIIDADGFPRAEVEVLPNLTRVPLPGLAPGVYTVEISADGRVVKEVTVQAYHEAGIVAATAVLLPNGTLIIDTQGYTSPCNKDYRIVAVRVVVNGTTYDFTDRTWRVGETIRLNLDIEISPNLQIQVLLVDSNGNIIQAKVAYPQ